VKWILPGGDVPSEVRIAAEQRSPAGPGRPLAELTEASVIQQVGHSYEGLSASLASACAVPEELRAQVRESGSQCVSVSGTWRVTPLSSLAFRNQLGRPLTFWTAGLGDHCTETLLPKWKLRWPVLEGTREIAQTLLDAADHSGVINDHPYLTVMGLALAPVYFLLRLMVDDSFKKGIWVSTATWTSILKVAAVIVCIPFVSDLVFGGFLGRAIDSARLNLRRLLPRPRVRNVAVTGAADDVQAWLACVTMIGSHTDRLEPIGPATRSLLQTMAGQRSEGVTIPSALLRVGKLGVVRLLPVTQSSLRDAYERGLMSEMLDGIVHLRRASDDQATPGVPVPNAQLLLSGRTDLADSSGLCPNGATAIKLIRTAFTRESPAGLDWGAVFDRLWAPVQQALSRDAEPPALVEYASAEPQAGHTPSSVTPKAASDRLVRS
jgi:hypothetical protein